MQPAKPAPPPAAGRAAGRAAGAAAAGLRVPGRQRRRRPAQQPHRVPCHRHIPATTPAAPAAIVGGGGQLELVQMDPAHDVAADVEVLAGLRAQPKR